MSAGRGQNLGLLLLNWIQDKMPGTIASIKIANIRRATMALLRKNKLAAVIKATISEERSASDPGRHQNFCHSV